jgi:peptidoglycan/LPS O-acetylase OafA/YrhL
MHFQVLDSWRGIAALLVATYHLQIFGHFYAVSLIRDAWLFVDFFFVLSGFVLAHAYADRLTNSEEFRIFAIRRFGRLWPLHIATAAFVALTEALKLGLSQSGLVRFEVPAFATDDWTWTMVAANLLMLHGLGVPGAAPLNGPSWTIATEFYAYLVFATVCLFARPRLIGTSLAIAGMSLLVIVIHSGATLYLSSTPGIFRCLYGFFVGVVVYQLWRRHRIRFPHMAACEFAAMTLVVVFVSLAGKSSLSLAAPFVFGLVVWVFAYEQGPISRILRTGPALWLGVCSYSIYLVHLPIYNVIQRGFLMLERRFGIRMTEEVGAPWFDPPLGVLSFGNMWVMDLVALLCLATVVGVASITYRLIEHPARRFFNDLAVRRRTLAANG